MCISWLLLIMLLSMHGSTMKISFKLVDKEILRIVSNIGIYCSSDKVGTVYLVQYIFENFTVTINALFSSCEDVVCCSSECILTSLFVGDNILRKADNLTTSLCPCHEICEP